MAATIASTLDLSRPSEKFGTHSTMVDISEKHIWQDPHLQAGDLSCAGGFTFHQQAPRVGDQVSNFKRLDQKRDVVVIQEATYFRLGQTGKSEQHVSGESG